DPREDEIVCTIEDDGTGVPPEKRDRIFDRGYTTDTVRGSGLGLFLVNTLIETYGGTIEVGDSDLGGATFEVHLDRIR
ncbi:MAG: ATP-binding protein, partial [Halodesulfurarchaeum sp.]